jgi:hypothetical protein
MLVGSSTPDIDSSRQINKEQAIKFSVNKRKTLKRNAFASKFTKSILIDEENSKLNEEIRIKKLRSYQNLMKKFINLCDEHGKSALHYAAHKS